MFASERERELESRIAKDCLIDSYFLGGDYVLLTNISSRVLGLGLMSFSFIDIRSPEGEVVPN